MDKVYYDQMEALEGQIWIASSEKGLVLIGINQTEEVFLKDLQKYYPGAEIQLNTKKNQIYIQQLKEYFQGQRKGFSLPLDIKGTPFQKQVWEALQSIPYGTTVTYKDIAQQIANPKAVRAVGMANNKNPLAIIIPCHRVIGASGHLVGYGGGLHIKTALLKLEGVKVQGEKVLP